MPHFPESIILYQVGKGTLQFSYPVSCDPSNCSRTFFMRAHFSTNSNVSQIYLAFHSVPGDHIIAKFATGKHATG